MRVLTVDATVTCGHELGQVELTASQSRVTIDGRPVLVYDDPEGRPIDGCPSSIAMAGMPCKATLKARTGYSDLVTVEGRAVCLDTLTGLTNGAPAGRVEYTVADAGQAFVSAG